MMERVAILWGKAVYVLVALWILLVAMLLLVPAVGLWALLVPPSLRKKIKRGGGEAEEEAPNEPSSPR